MAKIPQLTRGRLWTLKVVPRLRSQWGYCDYEQKLIAICKSTEKHGLSRQTFLHEMIHKICPWMDEEAVDHLATELDDGLEVADSLISM